MVEVYDPNSTPTWTLAEDWRFVWGSAGVSPASGGRLMLAEMRCTDPNDPCNCGTGFQPVRTQTWGLDLAGQSGSINSLEGAGGISGLLAVHDPNDASDPNDPFGDFVYTYDANGNVGQVVNWSADPNDPNGAIVAKYQYDPYGNPLHAVTDVNASGFYAAANPYRFSTKPFDDETGWGYWGERYYDPKQGRWTNHDPIGELGGMNLYAYVRQNPVSRYDVLGRFQTPGVPGVTEEGWVNPGSTIDSISHPVFGDKIKVMCDGNADPNTLTRAHADQLLNPNNDPRIKAELDRGCIGVCALFQDTAHEVPESDPYTKCYRSEVAIEMYAPPCPPGMRPFVFAKYGCWNTDPRTMPPGASRAPQRRSDHTVPNNSIMHPNNPPHYTWPGYNYVTVVRDAKTGRKCYIWVNHGAMYGTQAFTIEDHPYDPDPTNAPGLQQRIWCRTCR